MVVLLSMDVGFNDSNSRRVDLVHTVIMDSNKSMKFGTWFLDITIIILRNGPPPT